MKKLSSLKELEDLAEDLLRQAQALPAGANRISALKDIGKLRQRLDALLRQPNQDPAQAPSRPK